MILLAVKYIMRVIFNRQPVYTTYTIDEGDLEERVKISSIICAATQARPSGYKYMPAYKSRRWDGYIRLAVGNRIPTGLVPLVIGQLTANGYPHYEIVNYEIPETNPGDVRPDMFLGITLRQYQVDAIKLGLAHSRGIFKMATNAGKTEVIAALAGFISGNVLVLTTKKDILYQTATRIENRLQEEVGLVGDDQWDPKRITVGMIQTLSNNIHRMSGEFDNLACIMYDECHHISSKTSQAVMMGLQAPMRFGFSGTPLKNDNLSDLILMGTTGPVLLDVTNDDLVKVGISAKPTITMQTIDNMKHDGTWQEAYADCIVDNGVRNMAVCRHIASKRKQSTLVLVDRIAHGNSLWKMLDLAYPATFVHGSTPMHLRNAALNLLRKGDGSVVIATAAIFGEGVDVPAVDLLVLANGGKGHIKLLQNIGRGMRAKDNGNRLEVIDFVDDTSEYLLEHSLARALIYEQEGFDVRIVE